ncbi:MAG: transporter substrate-binding domain-containing protein [Lachnospiraceae bacterium]|nr:transporter substrate-binding domain-containing protein [Lachnospiraceae bacterium]
MNRLKPVSRPKQALLLALSLILLVLCLRPLTVRAEDTPRKVVRVGYVSAENYEEGGEGEYKRGFGYEYFQKISYITGWQYEYVHGSFAECYEKLVNGEIDLFGNVSYTDERAKLFFYSEYPEGKDTYWLYAANNRHDLITNDTSVLNGITIGVTRGSYQEGLLKKWLADKGINAELVGCDGFDDMMTRADAEEIDAFVAPDLSVNYGYSIITGIGFSEYYFAVSKNRPDILDELNAALYEIQNTESDYNSLLVNRYQYKMASGLTMNDEERTWLEQHDNTIRLGCLNNYLPFSGVQNGENVGILMTIVSSLENDYGARVVVSTYHNLDDMMKALTAGDIDIMGPVIGDFYLTEKYGCALTDAIMNTTPVII